MEWNAVVSGWVSGQRERKRKRKRKRRVMCLDGTKGNGTAFLGSG